MSRLKDLFYIDEHGRLYHAKDKANRKIKKHSMADTNICTKGYRTCCVDGVNKKAHRVVYEITIGEIPEGMLVDHIDGDKLNNSPSNLRVVTPQQNTWNRVKPPKIDLLPSGRFRVKMMKSGVHIGLGTYDTEEEALSVAKQARLKYFGEYANGVNNGF